MSSRIKTIIRNIWNLSQEEDIDIVLKEIMKYKNGVNKYFAEKKTNYVPSKKTDDTFTENNVITYDTFKKEYEEYYKLDFDNKVNTFYPSIYIIDSFPPFNLFKTAEKGLLDHSIFIQSLYSILWDCIRYYGWGHLSTIGYTSFMIEKINEWTRPNYIINGCFSQKHYTCGRAIKMVIEPGKNTRLVIHGTVSMENDYVDDKDYETRIKPILTNKYLKETDYKNKYIKYKTKYLNLKKQLEAKK